MRRKPNLEVKFILKGDLAKRVFLELLIVKDDVFGTFLHSLIYSIRFQNSGLEYKNSKYISDVYASD